MDWEQAVEWLRAQPDKQDLVRACYFDDPLTEAADRFWKGDEWRHISDLLPPHKGLALDLGAGRGISSYALARDGWQVSALEPDPSSLVGAGAIEKLNAHFNLNIRIVKEFSEQLPFEDNSFDLVYCRQVLHHANDLPKTCQEIFRVLKPGGRLVATREHVISKSEDLQAFLESHPLHHLYGGEHAYLLSEYQEYILEAGLKLKKTYAPFDSPVNYFPMSQEQWVDICTNRIAKIVGVKPIKFVFSDRNFLGRLMIRLLAALVNWRNNSPGRLYSFIAEKPCYV